MHNKIRFFGQKLKKTKHFAFYQNKKMIEIVIMLETNNIYQQNRS